MRKADHLFDDDTQKLFEHSEALLAHSQKLNEKIIMQSELLKALNEQSERLIESMRSTTDEAAETNANGLS